MPFGLRQRLEFAGELDVLLNVFQLRHTHRHGADWKGHRVIEQLFDRRSSKNLFLSENLHGNHTQVPRTRRNVVFIARTAGEPAALVGGIRDRIRAIDEELPVYDVRTMNNVIAESVEQRRFVMLLISIFAAIALLLASVGLYAVMSNLVAQRTREIGIRVALGARRGDVLMLVVRQGGMLTLAGVALGLACSFALTRTMESLLFGVSATEPLVFVVIPLLLAGVALGACLVPARRATKVDPMVALRYE
jgi:putative ABC transport system permease protein